MTSSGFGLRKPPHPTSIGGGGSNELTYREPACANRRALRLHARAAKKGGTNNEAADTLRNDCGLRRSELLGTSIPITPFFDVTNWSIATRGAQLASVP